MFCDIIDDIDRDLLFISQRSCVNERNLYLHLIIAGDNDHYAGFRLIEFIRQEIYKFALDVKLVHLS